MNDADHPFRPERFYVQQALLVILFNLLPLAFVFAGEWTPFEVIAFYWVEVVAAGGFALLRTIMDFVGALAARDWRNVFHNFMMSVFMPVHYGFFLVMTCFLVGSFLPEDVPKRMLTSPLVPLEMVVEHIRFWHIFPIFILWEAVDFFRQRWHAQHDPAYKIPNPVGQAYFKLFILFTAGFFGLFIAMGLDDRLWGAVLLVALKLVCALLPIWYDHYKDTRGKKAL